MPDRGKQENHGTLQSADRGLEAVTKQLALIVEQLKTLNANLAAAQKAKQANQVKDKFGSGIAPRKYL